MTELLSAHSQGVWVQHPWDDTRVQAPVVMWFAEDRFDFPIPADDLFRDCGLLRDPYVVQSARELFTADEVDVFRAWLRATGGPELETSAVPVPVDDLWHAQGDRTYSPRYQGYVSVNVPGLPFTVGGFYDLLPATNEADALAETELPY